MQIDTGMTGREALARLAKRRKTTVAQVLKSEIAAHRASCGRGALYRADIMGTSDTLFLMARRVITRRSGGRHERQDGRGRQGALHL